MDPMARDRHTIIQDLMREKFIREGKGGREGGREREGEDRGREKDQDSDLPPQKEQK